jgi:glycosyltransferase 2 family protein
VAPNNLPTDESTAAGLGMASSTERGDADAGKLGQTRSRFAVWRWGLALTVAAVLLYKALHGVDWAQVWLTVVGARWGYLAGAILISTGSFTVRALRWRILLNAGTAQPLPLGTVFRANMAGYLGNNVLPARAGEVLRSVLISSQSSLSRAYVLTAALSERMVDAIALVLWGSIMLSLVRSKPAWMGDVARTMGFAAGGGALVLMILPHVEGLVHRTLDWLPVSTAFRGLLGRMAGQILLALRSFHHVGRFLSFAGLTVVIWAIDATCMIVSAHGLGLDMGYPAAVLLITAMGLGSALPATPGYVGIYQFAAVTVLGAFGIGRDQALAYSLVNQALGFLVIAALGVPGLYGSLSSGKLQGEKQG